METKCESCTHCGERNSAEDSCVHEMYSLWKASFGELSLSSSLENLSNFSRFFVPGHKGVSFAHDATELGCTGNLFCSNGTIRSSEDLISKIYSSGYSCFSACGNTLCIQSILRLCFPCGGKLVVPRNVHKATIYAMGLLGIDPVWVNVRNGQNVNLEDLKNVINDNPDADGVFLTSPDYFGRMVDIASVRKMCKLPILVDNAHGSHLIFFENMHPISLGASFVADSAHKTLPVLTGGAWFHVSQKCAEKYEYKFEDLKQSAQIFASTSPSFLILESLEKCAIWMESKGKYEFQLLKSRVDSLKKKFGEIFDKNVDDPVRMCFDTAEIGYSSEVFFNHLLKFKVYPEFSTDSKTVLIPSPFNSEKDWARLETCLENLTPRSKIKVEIFEDVVHEKAMSIRDAMFSESEWVELEKLVGRISAQVVFECPPGISQVVPGETISQVDVAKFKKLGMKKIRVLK